MPLLQLWAHDFQGDKKRCRRPQKVAGDSLRGLTARGRCQVNIQLFEMSGKPINFGYSQIFRRSENRLMAVRCSFFSGRL
jgi:hypothetical protein